MLWAGNPKKFVSIQGMKRDISLLQNLQSGPWGQNELLLMGSGNKAQE
jgi:hypothetical protein